MAKKPSFIIAVLLLAVFVTGSVAKENESWKVVFDQSGLKVYNRSIKGAARELRAEFKINAPTWKVAAVVCDLDDYKDFMPFTVVSKVVSSEVLDENRTKYVFFTAIHPPLVNMRYFTLELIRENRFDGKENRIRIHWDLSKTTTIDWRDSSVRNLFSKETVEPVKVLFNIGHWVLEPLENNTKTLVHYYVQADPSGNLPSFLTEKANFILLPKLRKSVVERVTNPKYDSPSPGQSNL